VNVVVAAFRLPISGERGDIGGVDWTAIHAMTPTTPYVMPRANAAFNPSVSE
jgi:hypothetical protein